MRRLLIAVLALAPAAGLADQPHRSLHDTAWYVAHAPERQATIRLCESDAAYMRLTDCANAERAASSLIGKPQWKSLDDMLKDPRYYARAGDMTREGARLQCLRGRGVATPYCGAVARSYELAR